MTDDDYEPITSNHDSNIAKAIQQKNFLLEKRKDQTTWANVDDLDEKDSNNMRHTVYGTRGNRYDIKNKSLKEKSGERDRSPSPDSFYKTGLNFNKMGANSFGVSQSPNEVSEN
jgi:hypothetical protein